MSRLVLLVMFAIMLFECESYAQTVEGDRLRGLGAFASGVGWYNLRTAQANAINVQAMRNYNEEVRLNYFNRVQFYAGKENLRKLSKEEAASRIRQRMEQLRNKPTIDDLRNGEALNVLAIVLTDPSTTQHDWYTDSVSLPVGSSIKDIVFDYFPNSISDKDVKIKVAISRLSKDVDWPLIFRSDAFADERSAYEDAISQLTKSVVANKFDPILINKVDKCLDDLSAEVARSYASDSRGFKSKANAFLTELRSATKLFDGPYIDYAKDMLQDTETHDASSLGELIAFMLRYRLFFTQAESPRSIELYGNLYKAMTEQINRLDAAKGPAIAVVGADSDSNPGKKNSMPMNQLQSDITAPQADLANSIGMKMVLIRSGKFRMGSPQSEAGREADERLHEVTLSRDYLIGATEVTQNQWVSVMGTKPWHGKPHVREGANFPATYVGWNEAVEFCSKLSRSEKTVYRLPSEAEWEYACRGGTTTSYSFGDDLSQLNEYGWWGGVYGDGNAKTERYAHQVGQKRANPFGLFDMHGNVYEWCSDYYAEYPKGLVVDPTGPQSGTTRVNRDGGWNYYAEHCRSANRGNSDGEPHYLIGFRVVREK